MFHASAPRLRNFVAVAARAHLRPRPPSGRTPVRLRLVNDVHGLPEPYALCAQRVLLKKQGRLPG
jgi:hypothetical protein